MNSNKEIEQIFDILRKAGIRCYDDLNGKSLTRGKLLSAHDYSWVADLANIINSLYYFTEKHIGNIDGQVFLVDRIEAKDHLEILKYSCVFPDRMIISSGEFHYLDKAEHSLIEIDFFRKLFWSRDLLLNGIIHISPFYLCTDLVEGEGDIKNAMIESLTLPDKNQKKIAQLDEIGFDDIQHIPFIDKILVKLPWLYNAGIEDYLEIINANSTEFTLYNQYLGNLSYSSESSEDFLERYLKDFFEANVNIQIALERKQAELKAKGIITFISLCLTLIPLVVPENQYISPQVLSAILGGGTIKEIVDGINLVSEKRQVGKENPFWVLWKWKNL